VRGDWSIFGYAPYAMMMMMFSAIDDHEIAVIGSQPSMQRLHKIMMLKSLVRPAKINIETPVVDTVIER
jgi:hypothetical protein